METPPQPNNERVCAFSSHPFEHSLLGESMLELLVGKHMTFRDGLQRVDVGSRFVADKEDLSSTSLPKHTHHLKVVNNDLPLRFLESTRVGRLGALLARGAPASGGNRGIVTRDGRLRR